jgi:hypothetical protein
MASYYELRLVASCDTHSRTIPGTLDTVPNTTADRAHGERTAKVVEDDIGAERGERDRSFESKMG